LRNLDGRQAKELLDNITKLVPERTYGDVFDYRPWYVWEWKKVGRPPICVLFDANTSLPHPASTRIRITMFDPSGKALSETAFGTGHRCYLRDVVVVASVNDDAYPLICLETGLGGGPGPDIGKQYYGLLGSHFVLVRLEGSEGFARTNRYFAEHFRCGPEMPQQSAEKWTADLRSKDPLKVLRTLVWLGGTYSVPGVHKTEDVAAEVLQQASLVKLVRERDDVTARLKELANSKDRWLREAAELALNPKPSSF
jgi:hypothetical protein